MFGLPVGLVIGFGLIPGFGDPQKSLSGQIGTEYIASISVAIVLAVLGLTGVPMVVGQYRERGILRRLGVTPVIAMRQRVSRLAGQLEIESEPGAGTAVSASLPAIPLGGSR